VIAAEKRADYRFSMGPIAAPTFELEAFIMVDVYEMLRQKENDVVRVRKEIQALRFVAPLLSDSDEVVLQPEMDAAVSLEGTVEEQNPAQSEQSLDAPEVGEGIPPKRSRLLNLLGLASGE
jgi:hypothetical protein